MLKNVLDVKRKDRKSVLKTKGVKQNVIVWTVQVRKSVHTNFQHIIVDKFFRKYKTVNPLRAQKSENALFLVLQSYIKSVSNMWH